MGISFGEATDALLRMGKTVTRRVWADRHAAKFIKCYEEGLRVKALDKDLRYGGKQIGWLTLTHRPRKERLVEMLKNPVAEMIAEGFPHLSFREFVAKFFNDEHQEVWVIGFHFDSNLGYSENKTHPKPGEPPVPHLGCSEDEVYPKLDLPVILLEAAKDLTNEEIDFAGAFLDSLRKNHCSERVSVAESAHTGLENAIAESEAAPAVLENHPIDRTESGSIEYKTINGCGPYAYRRVREGRRHKSIYLGRLYPLAALSSANPQIREAEGFPNPTGYANFNPQQTQ